MPSQHADVWAAGDAYEFYMGRWSRAVARGFVAWLGIGSEKRWLDVGCGSGALSQTILAEAGPSAVVGIDASPGFVAHARNLTQDPRATFQTGDAQGLPVEDGQFDVAVAALALNFMPDPARAVVEMGRAVRSGGTVAAYVWDYAEGMALIRRFWDAAVALDPDALERDEARRFPLCQPENLRALFADAGLKQVTVEAIDAPTVFGDFDDYWSPFLGGQGPAPGYCMALSEERRAALRDRLKATLPARPDGSIALTARAFAVRGVKR